MRLYIAGPMRGFDDNNADAFTMAQQHLEQAGHQVFNPIAEEQRFRQVHPDAPPREVKAVQMWWLGMFADGIAVLPHWGTSYGAKAEVAFGEAIGVPHNFVSEWIRQVPA